MLKLRWTPKASAERVFETFLLRRGAVLAVAAGAADAASAKPASRHVTSETPRRGAFDIKAFRDLRAARRFVGRFLFSCISYRRTRYKRERVNTRTDDSR